MPCFEQLGFVQLYRPHQLWGATVPPWVSGLLCSPSEPPARQPGHTSTMYHLGDLGQVTSIPEPQSSPL